ncbi:DHA2 family efflux MFS transporter permease subunit [Novosphingobium aerophilum]|uniref:DHA2 family efflux MFS transporter permease subunit n=1 Tax=Novosphingobium TaxID=165696 RepID=UPI0006C88AD7|nr:MULTISPECIES: DHA2 family efflux MFS transporter permease subunit [unclassified Novosphingobium]KPH64801.1 multidrug resistance protein B [Novosphingobium sp. ST904]MPS69887.1 DHA2 family efflux MFS transporter permease subunit [Novosphingobium sp.]TCM34522.1 DHA2 family multidrug resistance protein [Novosphingobium sp. ST904]WRT92430.1 DHA2 family efflux MFS transporter permease subunit [Novosphingobium sp. RL4]
MASAPAAGAGAGEEGTLTGGKLLIAGFLLAMANFVVVLDMTIANVSIPHIAGGLGVSVSNGTWAITSYAVAEAICVPLTGWLSGRFGTLRVFLMSLVGFGVFSALCGIAHTFPLLVVFRLGQGFCGGPLMPLTQTLLLRIFPKHMHPRAMAMWAMTVVTAPIAGPILGGYIADNWSWEWIFFINVPIVILVFFALATILKGMETPTRSLPIDMVGLFLLICWVGAFQMMLDLGREHDWFGSPFIVALACIAVIFFIAFVVWELTEEHPVVDLKVFRHRGFSAATFSLTIAFGTYFSSVVVIPQWLQTSMGYTATQAGEAMAFSGVLAVIASPFVPKLMQRFDPRLLVFIGISWIAMCAVFRTGWSSDSTFWAISWPQLVQGVGVSLFMVPLTTISLSSVRPDETASAAGIANFGRTLAGAIATALVTTTWDDMSRHNKAELSGMLNGSEQTVNQLQQAGMSMEQARGTIDNLVTAQGTALGTVHVFALCAILLLIAAMTIWIAPRPPRGAKPASGGH